MRKNNADTANEARKLLYNTIKDTEHQYKREIFFNDNTKNDNNGKQHKDSDDNYKETTNKKQPTSKPNKGTKNEANKQNDVYDHEYTLDSDMFITGTSLNVGIENL